MIYVCVSACYKRACLFLSFRACLIVSVRACHRHLCVAYVCLPVDHRSPCTFLELLERACRTKLLSAGKTGFIISLLDSPQKVIDIVLFV